MLDEKLRLLYESSAGVPGSGLACWDPGLLDQCYSEGIERRVQWHSFRGTKQSRSRTNQSDDIFTFRFVCILNGAFIFDRERS